MHYRSGLAFFTGFLFALPAFGTEWQLRWSEEFDGKGLPDPAKWVYEVGFVRNRELQYYTKERLENVRMENGNLVIEGRKERFTNPEYKAGVDPAKNPRRGREYAEYTSGSINTYSKASFLYGRIEVRAKLSQGKGTWPAIWMLGDHRNTGLGWPKCGEIDIMEFVGHDPNRVHATVHFSKENKHASKGGKLQVSEPWEGFHIYAVEWFSDRMDFYYDKTKYFTFNLDDAGTGPENPFRKPQYLLLNLALGGSWGGKIDDSILPQKYLIDYVRIYEEKK